MLQLVEEKYYRHRKQDLSEITIRKFMQFIQMLHHVESGVLSDCGISKYFYPLMSFGHLPSLVQFVVIAVS